MSIRRSITDEIAGIPPDGSLLVEIARSRHPTTPCNGCDFRSVYSVCDYCGCTQPIDIDVTTVAEIAAANGYVKADDYEALKAKLAEVADKLDDATDALDLIESEADLFDATAIASGYVKLADDEIVIKRGTLNALIDDHCADCTFDSLEIHDCDNCDLKPIRDRLNEVGK